MELKLDSPVQYVPRVGPRMATLLRKLGIETVYNLLTYVPFRYNDYSLVTPIRRVQPGEIVTLVGDLEYIRTFITKNGKRLVMAKLRDESGSIEIIWFNQTYLVNVLKPDDVLSVSGKVDWFGQKLVLASPEYEVLSPAGEQRTSLHTGRLVPVYPETSGLSSKWLRGKIAYALEHCLPLVTDHLPQSIQDKQRLMRLPDAIAAIHFPESPKQAAKARERLAFDELFTLILRSHLEKQTWKTSLKARTLPLRPQDVAAFKRTLPFTLTPDQDRAVLEITQDLSQPIPMNRLLEGDVGAGKTVVAAAGMYAAFLNGESSVLLAPTQILAQQHADTLAAILETPHSIPVRLILGGKKPASAAHTSSPSVFVGTHALLSRVQQLPHFGFIVIDEQQRFGVNQRALLRTHTKKGFVPHQLTMTATPIPRTIAQTVFGNLDLSVIANMPHGRIPVKTWVVSETKRSAAYTWIETQLRKSKSQAFIICPLIEESETMTAVRAATSEYERLKTLFSSFRLGLLHGRMKSEEKARMLASMHEGNLDILVATPVVEVGIDIPEATIILIEAAERFGLSQLHQLRGRVGRRNKASYCLLFTDKESPEVLARLKALETVHSGPELAELDLKFRGPGELFGTRQHGLPGFTLASLADSALVSRVQQSVKTLTHDDPGLTKFPHLRDISGTGKIDAVQS